MADSAMRKAQELSSIYLPLDEQEISLEQLKDGVILDSPQSHLISKYCGK